jgi:uncharacterized cupin superfamily protein
MSAARRIRYIRPTRANGAAFMTRPILNLADAPAHAGSNGDRFAYQMRELAGPLGAERIGADVTIVPPGKAAFPFHHHHANEEHFFVLSGSGVMRAGAETYPVRPHDYIVNLPGAADLAHQLVNTGKQDLVYLAISTCVLPEVVGYPDSGKTGVRIAASMEPDARFLVADSAKAAAGYWDREDGSVVAALVGTGGD